MHHLAQTGNLEIPDSRFARPGMTGGSKRILARVRGFALENSDFEIF